ncbi:hypothetical protein BDW60DRAFT_175375 [Aspergillus nidulans var. acristatus]
MAGIPSTSACVDRLGRIPAQLKTSTSYHISPELEIESNEQSSQPVNIRKALTNEPYYAASDFWVCCRCGDGPKVYTYSIQCVLCNHIVCELCTRVK